MTRGQIVMVLGFGLIVLNVFAGGPGSKAVATLWGK